MKRPLKSRICRLLACISPLTTAEICRALDAKFPTLKICMAELRRSGVICHAQISERQRHRQHGHRDGWELT